jgi:signal transduction histidine kinase
MLQPPDQKRSGAPPREMTTATAALAIVAHELRNPVGAIRYACRTLEAGDNPPDAVERARQMIARQAAHLAVLVEDLLDLPLLSEGKFRLKRQWLDVVPELEAAVESCSWAIEAAGHVLAVEVPSGPLYAYVDGSRLRQALTNLLDNACKYTPASGRVNISLSALDGFAVFKVQDNGRGIASNSLEHLFKLFRRLPSEFPDGTEGLGIGLALVHEIARQHGGQVWAVSPGPGQGSTFVLRLPVPAGASTRGPWVEQLNPHDCTDERTDEAPAVATAVARV